MPNVVEPRNESDDLTAPARSPLGLGSPGPEQARVVLGHGDRVLYASCAAIPADKLRRTNPAATGWALWYGVAFLCLVNLVAAGLAVSIAVAARPNPSAAAIVLVAVLGIQAAALLLTVAKIFPWRRVSQKSTTEHKDYPSWITDRSLVAADRGMIDAWQWDEALGFMVTEDVALVRFPYHQRLIWLSGYGAPAKEVAGVLAARVKQVTRAQYARL